MSCTCVYMCVSLFWIHVVCMDVGDMHLCMWVCVFVKTHVCTCEGTEIERMGEEKEIEGEGPRQRERERER